jgi:signal transduction histidine kinase
VKRLSRFLSPYSTGTWVLISLLLLVLIASNTYVSRMTISELTELQEDISQTSKVVAVLDETHVNLLTAESGQRGFLLTDDERYLDHYKEAVSRVRALLIQTEELQPKDPAQKESINELRALIEQKVKELDVTVAHAQENHLSQAFRIAETDEGRVLYDQILNLFERITLTESVIGKKQVSKLQQATKESSKNLSISFFTSLVLVVGVFLLARVNIKNQEHQQQVMEAQNDRLKLAVEERTKELSLFSDELSRSNRELEDFAFVASHDLQEPLRKIMAFGGRLESQAENLNDKQRDFLQRMRSAASRMSILISDLLEFSRVSTRGKPFQSVDLNTVVQNCIDDLNVLIEETNVTIDVEHLPIINADPTQMQQLLFNLIANAIKFSQNESHPSVEISALSVDQPESVDIEGLKDWFCIRVADNGIGFEQEHADKIFAPFQRLHSRDKFKGTGIGLAICRRIVERHNGIIEAKGETDKGAVFKLTLPADNFLISIKQ